MLYNSYPLYSLFLSNLSLRYQETLCLWSLSHCAHTTASRLKWSLLSSMVTSFPSQSHLRPVSIKFLSHRLLWLTLLLLAPANPHRSPVQQLLVRVSENIRVLYTSGFLLRQAAAILDQRPLSPSKNLKKKRLTLQTKSR